MAGASLFVSHNEFHRLAKWDDIGGMARQFTRLDGGYASSLCRLSRRQMLN